MASSLARIGISLDFESRNTTPGTISYYCLRENYCQAVHEAGGLPVLIPYVAEAVEHYLDMLDGLIIPGGDFAFPDSWYYEKNDHSPFSSSPRVAFDIAILNAALARNIPVLGICAGMQILACLHGCKLTSQIHSEIPHQGIARTEYAHNVSITKGSQLGHIVGAETLQVNSAHREAVVTISPTVTVNARAQDGTIEGIEIPGHSFAIGVQWHPEFFIASDNPHRMLFTSLIEHAIHS